MDKRLLFSAALVAAFSANEAKATDHVTEPTAQPTKVNLKLDGTDTVAIKNVKADMWLVNGLAYETQTSLAKETSTTSSMGVAIVPVEGKKGCYTLFNNNVKKGTDFTNKIFYNASDDNGGNSYVDYASQGIAKTYWEIYLNEDGTFQLQADTTSNKSTTSKTRAGYNPNDNGLDGVGTEVAEGFANFRPVLKPSASSDYGLDWQAYSYEYFYRKDILMPAINTAIDDNPDCDFDAVVKIYNDEKATLGDLKRAKQMINEIIRNNAIKGGTADSPADLTAYITNASCDALTGWTYECEYDTDGNVGSGGHGTNWQAHSGTYTSADKELTTSKFIERWISSSSNPSTNNAAGTGHLSDGYIKQTLTNLPAGGYRVSCYAMATNQGKGDDYTVTGVSLFATSGENEKSAAVATKAGVPQKFTFLMAVGEGQDLTVGFKLDNTDANWVFVDEFKVEYCGQDAKLMNLTDMQDVATEMQDNLEGYAACPTYIKSAQDLIEKALDMSTDDNTEEEIADMKKQLEAAQALIETSVDKYVAFQKLLDEINAFMSEGFESEEVSDLDELVNDCGNDDGESAGDLTDSHSLNNDELDAYTVKLEAALDAARKSVIEAGSDVTYKITNPSFTNGQTGWTCTNSPVTSSSYENTEAYEKTFDMHQDLTNLPNGVYQLSVQAMHRVGTNATAAPMHENDTEDITACLYANDLTTKFASPYSASMASASGGSPADYEYNGGYIANSMQGFQTACAENKENYKVTLNVLVTDGNLTVGVKETTRPSSNSGDWAIWDNFTLTYVGNDQTAINTVSGPVIEQAEALYKSPMNADVLAALKEAVSKVQTEGKASTISALSAAIQTAEASIAAYKPLATAIENAKSRYETNEASYTTSEAAKAIYTNALQTAQNAYDNGTVKDDEVSDAIKALNSGFTQYVINDSKATASETSPADITNVIINSDFSTMDTTGWTAKTGTPGFQSSNNVECAEFYNCTFDYRQEIVGLPAGKYILQTRSFYRNGSSTTATVSDDDETLKYNVNENAYLYFSDKSETESDVQAADADSDLPESKVALKPITAHVIDLTTEQEELGLSGNTGLTSFGTTEEGNTTYVVNDMIRANILFKNETYGSKFDSDELEFNYDGQSDFRIGFIKTVSESADWTIIKNVTLKYAGASKDATGISEVTTGDAVATKIYTTDGVQVSKLQKGINIVETTMKDGSKKVKKVVVK